MMVLVNSIFIILLVVLLLVAIVQIVMDSKGLKENVGTLVGLIIWLMVVVAIGFQELPWLRALVEPKA